VELLDEGVDVLVRVEFFVLAFALPLVLDFMGVFGFGVGSIGNSFHNVTILMILFIQPSSSSL
jgi:hypothetical protein